MKKIILSKLWEHGAYYKVENVQENIKHPKQKLE
jgi:hypothetical protein